MLYLHKSVFQSHGYLSSANCHVDNRWVLKISGFALDAFKMENYREQVYICFCFANLSVKIIIYICILALKSTALVLSCNLQGNMYNGIVYYYFFKILIIEPSDVTDG